MRKTNALLAPLVLAVAALHASAFAGPPKLSVGRFVTADGMTLYTFDNDTTPGVSASTGGCMSNWRPRRRRPTSHRATGR